MAIGIMLTFFDFRNDVRKVIEEMCKHETVVVFIRKEHEALIQSYVHLGFTYRIIDEHVNSLRNRFVCRLFLVFRKLPASKQNYYLMEQFKAEGATPENRKKALSIIRWQQRTPKYMSYDRYLGLLQYAGKTDLTGISKMIAWTEIYDDYLLARCLAEQIPVLTYVYSWDHACKHVRFSKQLRYAVWHSEIAQDVATLQNISATRITIAGASQLGFIYNMPKEPLSKENIIYFGCGVGLPTLVAEEVRIITILASHVLQLLPDYTLVVRPYPNAADWSVYDMLLAFPNIRIDNSYRQKDLSVQDADIMQKFHSIATAKAFFHVGTTLGLEACFTNTPSFILDLATENNQAVSIYHFVHQYQNEKYLMRDHPDNTIRDEMQLRNTLIDLENPKYLQLNASVQSTFMVRSFADVATTLLSA